ncbi:MAG: hypothetical protein ABIS67_02000 [Candidatus Eisenbacteria bacterium]
MGGAFVVWIEHRDGAARVRSTHILADGSKAAGWSGSGLELSERLSDASNPAMVALPGGAAFVAWEARHAVRRDIAVQRITAEGVAAGWPEGGVVLTEGAEEVASPQLLADAQGSAFLLYTRSSGTGSVGSEDLVLVSVGEELASGVPPSLAAVLSSEAIAYGNVAACALPGGGVILSWGEWRPDGASLRAQWLEAPALAASWEPGGVLVQAGEVGRDAPIVRAASDSTIAITWQGYSTDAESDIFVQLIGPAGTPAPGWPTGGRAACVARGDQFAPMLASDGQGGVLVGWLDGRPLTGEQPVAAAAPARAAVQLIESRATPGRARIVWRATQWLAAPPTAQRRIDLGPWEPIAAPAIDDSARITVDDRTVPDGVHAEFRLLLKAARTELHSDVVALEIPVAPRVLTLHRVRALAREHALLVSFALPRGESPRLDLLDVQGRRMFEQRLEGLEPGEQQYRWSLPGRMASGIYFIRLVQGRDERTAKVPYIR